MQEIKVKRTGYKGFNVREDGTLYCRNMTFKVGEIAEVKGEPVICENGIHFCWELNDVHTYYNLTSCVICEVEPVGDVVADSDGKKCCTNKLKLIRMLTKEEVLKISNSGSNNTGVINTGDCNTGDCNTGDCNTGDWNTGDWNTGDRNTGDWNTGDWNTGNRNTGDRNTGDRNTGDCNTGDRNTGDCNTGDWNTGNRNTGFFNQKENKCYIFDKLSDMTPTEFRNSKYHRAIRSAPFVLTEWIYYTEEEKANDKAKELIGGYLKKYEWKDACAKWWGELSEESKEIIKSIPNFTKTKFKKITGIEIK